MARKYQPKFRYVLRCMNYGNPLYVAPVKNQQTQVTDRIEEAEVFDDRDNHELKARFFKAQTGYEFTMQRI